MTSPEVYIRKIVYMSDMLLGFWEKREKETRKNNILGVIG